MQKTASRREKVGEVGCVEVLTTFQADYELLGQQNITRAKASLV